VPEAASSSVTPEAWPPAGCALVTGGSRGIGAAIATGLAADGWAVGVNYNSGAEAAAQVVAEIERAGGRAVAIQADVADPAAPDQVFTQLEQQLGMPVLALVNNAGITRDNLSPSLTDDEWEAVIDTNLTAAFRFTRRALKTMMRARTGRIVNIASVSGLRANPGQSNYGAAKAGLIQFTRTAAVEVARRGITINGGARVDRDRYDSRSQHRSAECCAGQAGRHTRGRRRLRTLPRIAAGRLRDRRGTYSRWRPGCLNPAPEPLRKRTSK
jgi:3-oxoacyl-[acyl-carrier protein] reductase